MKIFKYAGQLVVLMSCLPGEEGVIDLESDVKRFVRFDGLLSVYNELWMFYDLLSSNSDMFPHRQCKIGCIYLHDNASEPLEIWGGRFYIPNYYGCKKKLDHEHFFNYYSPKDAIIDITASMFNVHFEDIKIPDVLVLPRSHWFVKKHYICEKKNLKPHQIF